MAAEHFLGEADYYGNRYSTPLVTGPGCVGLVIGSVAALPVGLAAGGVAAVAAAPFGKAKEAGGAVAGSVIGAGFVAGTWLVGGPFWLVDRVIPHDPRGVPAPSGTDGDAAGDRTLGQD